MMLTPEQLAELRWQIHYAKPVSNVLAVTTAKLEGLFAHIDAQAQQLNTQRIMIEAQSAVKGRIRDEASKRGRDASSAVSELDYLIELIDAQQARIAELEENAGAHALAMKAGKAMLQAETERADKAEAERDHWKANHDNQVLRARLLIEREDLPLERVKAYQRMQELEKDAARYQYISSACTVTLPDGTECEDQQQLDVAMQPTWPEDTSDYGSRIAVIWQNGAAGEHYREDGKPA